MSDSIRISRYTDPETGGRKVQFRTFHRHTTVRWSKDLTRETTLEWWKDVGVLMPEVKNHVKEQPTNKWKQFLIDRQRAEAGVS